MSWTEFRLEDYCIKWNNRTIHPDDVHHPGDCHLVVGLFSSELQTFRVEGIDHVYICSNQVKLIRLMLTKLRCSLDFQVSSYEYGGFKVGQQWLGVLALFQQRVADVIPHFFSLHGHREELIHYDFMMPQKDLMTILSFPKLVANTQSPLKLLEFFSPLVWLSIAAMFVAFGFIHYLNSNRFSRRPWNTYDVLLTFMDMFALLIGQGTVALHGRTRNVLRNPLYLFIFVVFLFRQLFSSDITAILLSMRHITIDSFDQLQSMSSRTQIICEDKSSSHAYFMNKFPKLRKQIVTEYYNDVESVEVIQRLISTQAVLITSRSRAEIINDYYYRFKFHISQEGFYLSMGNFGIRKTLEQRLKLKLTRFFRDIFYFGMAESLDMKMKFNAFMLARKLNFSSVEEFGQAVLEHQSDSLTGTGEATHGQGRLVVIVYIYLYALGIILAFLTLLAEIGLHRWQRRDPFPRLQ